MCKFLLLAFVIMTTSIFAQNAPPVDAGVPQTLAKWRAANYRDVRYKLNLTLEKMSPVLKGTIEISVKVGDEGGNPRVSKGVNSTENNTLPDGRVSASEIILDWRKIRGKEDASTVSNVSLNGKPAKFEEINEHLIFKDGVKTGENVIKLDFTSPIATSGAAITRYVDKEDGAEYVYSLFVPSDASTAFPVFDQPDLKARFQLTTYTPDPWKVVSNANALDYYSNKIGWTYTNFEETKPISTYVFAFAAGDFAEFEDKESSIPSKIYVRKSQAAKLRNTNTGSAGISARNERGSANNQRNEKSSLDKLDYAAGATFAGRDARAPGEEIFRLNREAIKYLESYFDYKFPFPKYDLVLIPEFPFGGMEHAGATFLREDRVIFPTEPTKNDYITRANVIFHEAAHQWFGDTVTMKWFDDLWLKEGFAEFMAYKTLEKVMPEYNAWKIFYERNKQLAYLTDSTRGTTPIYQEIPNLSAAKSAYGNIVYRKAPSFLRQAEFYLGEDKFQTAVRAFLKKHEFANAEWTDLVKEFETASKQDLKDWANVWVKQRGLPRITFEIHQGIIGTSYATVYNPSTSKLESLRHTSSPVSGVPVNQTDVLNEGRNWTMRAKFISKFKDGRTEEHTVDFLGRPPFAIGYAHQTEELPLFVFPNYQDYGYGIFLLDEKSRAYVLANIQNEKDDFLRTMMWGSLWDSVREAELAPRDYVALVIKNINVESDESTIQTLLARVSTAMNYYLSDKQRDELAPQLETLLMNKMQGAPSLGQRITFYRSFISLANSEQASNVLRTILIGKLKIKDLELKTKDKFDIITKLITLGDKNALDVLAYWEKNETSDEAKRYAYAAKAGIATAENKQKIFSDFTNNKEISESYIETAFVPFNSTKHADLTLPFLESALKELPNLKRNRKIFFVNGWLSAFIGGQKSEQALAIVNKFLADNPNLDKDLRLKILEVSDGLERAVKIRAKYGK